MTPLPFRRFGPHWSKADGDDEWEFMPTPVDRPCVYCRELIELGDSGQEMGVGRGIEIGQPEPHVGVVHIECTALHTVGHQFGVCHCHGFPDNRASALELWKRIKERRGLRAAETEH